MVSFWESGSLKHCVSLFRREDPMRLPDFDWNKISPTDCSLELWSSVSRSARNC